MHGKGHAWPKTCAHKGFWPFPPQLLELERKFLKSCQEWNSIRGLKIKTKCDILYPYTFFRYLLCKRCWDYISFYIVSFREEHQRVENY